MVERTPTGIRLIIAYKIVKSVVEVAAGVALLLWASPRHIAQARDLLDAIDAHLTPRWSVYVAHLLAVATSTRTVRLATAALGLDGVVSFIEGYCLWRGYRWAPWLVVIATATPLPLEIQEIVRHAAPGRILIIAINIAVVVYLAARIFRRHRAAWARST